MVGARLQLYSSGVVSVAIFEFLSREVIAQRQRLEKYGPTGIRRKLQIKKKRSRACDFVNEAAAHSHSDIKVRLNLG